MVSLSWRLLRWNARGYAGRGIALLNAHIIIHKSSVLSL
jgi:hypothetical protein